MTTDHLEPEQVERLIARIDAEQGRLDVLVNDVWGGEKLFEWDTPVWEHDLANGLHLLDLAKSAVIRLAYAQSKDLAPHGGTAVALTPGWLRSEMMLDAFGVTEDNWRDATERIPHFAISETPRFVGRAVAALAADPDVARHNGASLSSGALAREYGFTDLDGSRPDAWRYMVEVQDPGLPANADPYR